MKFYHVNNRGRGSKSHWLIAKDEDDAKRIASTQKGKVEEIEELKPVDNIKKLLKEGKTGLLSCKLQGFMADELFDSLMKTGKPPKPPKDDEKWFIYQEI